MNKKKLNNNGFSLVELIIVIAIMAVLVGVLAPTYMQYVEKSKKSNDISTIDSVISAMEVCAVDSSLKLTSGDKIMVKLGSGTPAYSASTLEAANEMKKICKDSTTLKSDFKNGVTIVGEVGSDGVIKISILGTKGADVKTYSAELSSRATGTVTTEPTGLTDAT